MTITETLNELHNEIDNLGLDIISRGIEDDIDLTIFALNYLKSNLDDAFSDDDNFDNDDEARAEQWENEHRIGSDTPENDAREAQLEREDGL